MAYQKSRVKFSINLFRRKAVPRHLALVVGLDRIVANLSVGSVAAGFRKGTSSSRILKNLANHVRGN
jgi:hypothetical protein